VGKKHIVEKNQEDVIEDVIEETKRVEESLKKQSKGLSAVHNVLEGKIYISSSYNNTIITIADAKGQVLATKSAGSVGFKGTKKATSFAASRVAEAIINICRKLALGKIEIFIKGIGAGRESALRTLVNHNLNILSIKDITPIPHNGCRSKKVRRV